jgi:threonine aldolase
VTPHTNIVFVDLTPERARRTDKPLVERARDRGVLCTGLYRLRLVTHLDVSRADITRAIQVLRDVL